jgi:hypothetical protein
MKAITLQEAYKLIENAKAVIIDDDGLCYPSLDHLNGEAENEWLYCSWIDSEGDTYAAVFIEEPCEIYFDGTSIYMKDGDDEDSKITLLKPFNEIEFIDVTY